MNPLKWRGRDRLLVGGELLAFVSATSAIPAVILGWGYAPWLLAAATMVGTLAILLYAVDVITSGDTMLGIALTQQEFDDLKRQNLLGKSTMYLITEEK